MPRVAATTRRAAISGDIVISKVSGEVVKISGETVVSDVSGQWVIAKISGEVVKVSGELVSVITRSGDYVVVSGTVAASVSGQPVKVSGEVVKISGETVRALTSGDIVISKVSGEVVDLKVPTSVTSGGIFVVTAASGGAILTSGACISATVKAMSKNSGDIFVAGNPMQSGQGFVLEAGEAINLDVDNFGRIRLLAVISGDRVTFVGVA